MKLKYLSVVLIVVFILLMYNIFCYYFVNKSIDNGTRNIITNYLNNSCNKCDYQYEYLKATINDDSTINVFIKVDSKYLEEYYRFVVINNNGYKLVSVNTDIPAYIK